MYQPGGSSRKFDPQPHPNAGVPVFIDSLPTPTSFMCRAAARSALMVTAFAGTKTGQKCAKWVGFWAGHSNFWVKKCFFYHFAFSSIFLAFFFAMSTFWLPVSPTLRSLRGTGQPADLFSHPAHKLKALDWSSRSPPQRSSSAYP